jgi:hypothetical protein
MGVRNRTTIKSSKKHGEVKIITLAQSNNTPIKFEVVGTIQAMDAHSITVNGQIIGISGVEVSLSLEVGLAVRVHCELFSDGRIAAKEVKAAESSSILSGEVEVIGV